MANVKDSSVPSFLIPQDGPTINMSITGTDALLADQGYTYNQAGFSYNQAGVQYGGIYNANEDIIPMVLSAKIDQPMDLFISDQYTHAGVNNQKVVGLGFWMYVAIV